MIELLEAYKPHSETESAIKERFIDFVKENDDCFFRSNLKGHITASAFVIDPEKGKLLLIHHKKLNKWLQPGGHCDGDTDTLNVAIKEVFEETGVMIEPNHQPVIDLDIHTIPERKGVPEHEHFDVRYLFEADSTLPLIQNHETIEIKWIELQKIEDFTQEESIIRNISKMV